MPPEIKEKSESNAKFIPPPIRASVDFISSTGAINIVFSRDVYFDIGEDGKLE